MKSATLVQAAVVAGAAPATIHLCGDSTMSSYAADSAIHGWGEYLRYSFDPARFAVKNAAIGGRSARSFTREGRFATVAAGVKPGDWVVVEFGHNDGGSLSKDNGRSDCSGDGSQTCETTYNGAAEVVQTYPTYLKNATSIFLKAGAKVVISAPTPNNVWESGSYSWSPGRFDTYAAQVATQSGGPKAGVYFVAHGQYAAQAMRNLGPDTVGKGYPNDHTHTSAALADAMARSFVLGLACGTSELGKSTLNATADMTKTYLGECIVPASGAPV